MSLLHISDRVAEILQKREWELVKYGKFSCIVPSDPNSILPDYEPEPLKAIFDDKLEGPEEFVQRLIEIVNPISSKQAKNDLLAVRRQKEDQLMDPKMALVASQLLERMCYSSEARIFICGLFRYAPLMTPSTETCDAEQMAIVRAQICEACARSDRGDENFSDIQIPKYEPNELINNRRIATGAAEVYLKDEAFEEVIGMSKEKFYSLTAEEQTKIRQTIANAG